MKNLIKCSFAVFVLSVILFVSCQSDGNNVSSNPGNIQKSMRLHNYLTRMSMYDTYEGNVIDGTDCFGVKLPVTVEANGQTVVITSFLDYETIRNIFSFSNSDVDTIEFHFPIVLKYANYLEVAVYTQNQFEAIKSDCNPNLLEPITCSGVEYPIQLSVYSGGSQQSNFHTISNDLQLYNLLTGLSDDDYYTVQYPVSIITKYGPAYTVSNNSALEAALGPPIEGCEPLCDNANILTDDLILYIPFSNQIVDLTYLSTPTITGNYHFVTDRSGNPEGAISLDDGTNNGQNTIQTYQSAAGNLMQNGQFTMSLWYNRQVGLPANQMEQLINSQAFVLDLGNDVNNGNMGPWLHGAGSGTYDPSWAAENLGAESGVWHHVAITYESNTRLVNLYRDGVLRASYIGNTDIASTIVGMSFGNAYKGYIDDIRCYKRALNATEIQTLYNLPGDVYRCLY